MWITQFLWKKCKSVAKMVVTYALSYTPCLVQGRNETWCIKNIQVYMTGD